MELTEYQKTFLQAAGLPPDADRVLNAKVTFPKSLTKYKVFGFSITALSSPSRDQFEIELQLSRIEDFPPPPGWVSRDTYRDPPCIGWVKDEGWYLVRPKLHVERDRKLHPVEPSFRIED